MKRRPIPFTVRHRPPGTVGGETWIVDIHAGPARERSGYPCEFRRWELAAVFIGDLGRGVVNQGCFAP